MVWQFKLLGCGAVVRPNIRTHPSPPFPEPPEITILTEEFEVFESYLPCVGMIAGRHLPSHSFSQSALYGKFPVEYGPTQINLQCVYNSLRKACVRNVVLPERIQIEIRTIIDKMYGPYMIGTVPLSFVEALERIDDSKSPGHPMYYACHQKKQVLENPKMYKYLKECIIRWLKDPTYIPIWTGTLKDELTHLSKIRSDSTRMFFNGPFWFLMCQHILYGNMQDRLKGAMGQHPSTLGISVPGPALPNLLFEYQSLYNEYIEEGYGTFQQEMTPYVTMFDLDHTNFDLSVSLSIVQAASEVKESYLPMIGVVDIDGEQVEFDYIACHRACVSQIYCGFVAVGGMVYNIMGNKSGQLLTGDDNSIHEPATIYPGVRPYLDPQDPVKTFLSGKHSANGDDALKLMIFYKRVDVKTLFANCALYGTYLSTVSGFTENALDMMYLSHKVKRAYIPFLKQDMWIAQPRENKLLSALSFKKRKDDALTVARFYAVCNGLFGYESRYKALQIVDKWVSENPRHKLMDTDWKAAISQRLSDRQLATIHFGIDYNNTS